METLVLTICGAAARLTVVTLWVVRQPKAAADRDQG